MRDTWADTWPLPAISVWDEDDHLSIKRCEELDYWKPKYEDCWCGDNRGTSPNDVVEDGG